MIKQFLNLSTVHVSPAARHWLEANAVENAKQAAENAATHPVAAFMHGWMMLIPSPEDWPISDVPADLQDVCVEAMLSGCDYVLFEANGDVYETIPTFAEPDDPGGDGLTDEERAAMGFEAPEKPEDDGSGIHDELDDEDREAMEVEMQDKIARRQAIHPEDGMPMSHGADGVAHGGKPG